MAEERGKPRSVYELTNLYGPKSSCDPLSTTRTSSSLMVHLTLNRKPPPSRPAHMLCVTRRLIPILEASTIDASACFTFPVFQLDRRQPRTGAALAFRSLHHDKGSFKSHQLFGKTTFQTSSSGSAQTFNGGRLLCLQSRS